MTMPLIWQFNNYNKLSLTQVHTVYQNHVVWFGHANVVKAVKKGHVFIIKPFNHMTNSGEYLL